MPIVTRLKSLFFFALGWWLLCTATSCGNSRSLVYMQGQFDTTALSKVNAVEPIIRIGDILSIIVYSDNPEATRIYNQSLITTATSSGAINSSGGGGAGSGGSAVIGTNPSTPGYQVDANGNIVFQGIGLLHVEGLTKAQLKDTLDVRLTPFLQHPYYNIRFLNYKFTMLGEVAHPGIINIPGERINLLEAIAMAGDLTFYGRRDNVLVIRENNNKREFARLDLTRPDIMESPYFYLQQNDMVYVEPNKRKVPANDVVTARNIGLAISMITAIAVIYSIFK
ncbi:MAG TPA: polysaccharide biosynthesis/export family protein [Puia sp.]|nr:polysaccharide biosynthesis/export family protein [Puia sp.]